MNLRLAVASIVFDTNKSGIIILLEPACAIFKQVKVPVRPKRHVHRVAELVAGHEFLHFKEVAFLIHGDRHNPSAYPFVDEQFAIVVIGESPGCPREICSVGCASCHRWTSAAAHERKLWSALIRTPNEGGLSRR